MCVYTHTHTIEYYSPINNNENRSFAGKWMELEIIMLSMIIVRKTNIAHFLSYVESRFGAESIRRPIGRRKGNRKNGRGGQEMVIGAEYDQSTLYTCMKMS
jgi:hypothetical protein